MKKSLGQHFLTSHSAITKIIAAANLTKDDTVLEIGPGGGVLTEALLASAGKVIAIEKDQDLIPSLEGRFSNEIGEGKLQLLQEDVLSFDPVVRQDLTRGYKLVANIPYYITGAIIEQFLSTSLQPRCMVLLIQKEVADRIVAKGGKESVLSIAVKAYGNPKIIAKVPAGAFNPPPKVDSAIIAVDNISRNFFVDVDETLFFRVIKAIFGKKRKQIGGSLADFLKNKDKSMQALQQTGIDPRTRPEDIALQTWKSLVQTLE